jgi:DNA polymerase III delta subunit
MLKLYFGTDRQKVRDAATSFFEAGAAPDATITTLDAQSFVSGQITDALGAASLFGGEEWFVIDTPSANADLAEEVKNSLKEMSESANTFVILEGALLAPAKKSYAKYADSSEEFTADKAERFNTFAMADALAQKDRRQLWVLLQAAKSNGQSAEEIIGILWWQLKALRLAGVTNTASEAGMKDFPYNKAKRSLTKFAPGDVTSLSQSLLELYHDGHGGIRDIDLALEEWVLSGK